MVDFTEVTNESWFSRIGNSFKGIVAGVVMIAIAFFLLFWNEGRAVKRYKTLKEGVGKVLPVGADTVDTANEGQLVHLSGDATTEELLQDSIFGESHVALRLKRDVEMYQWKESSRTREKKKLGGGVEKVTEYTYDKSWSKTLISSSNFKQSAEHRNPDSMPYPSKTMNAKDARVGAFEMTSALLSKMNGFESVIPSELPKALQSKATIQGEQIYVGADAAAPKVSDVRVRFSVVNPGTVSIVANQVGDSFEPYRSKNGGSILLLQSGTISAEAMFQQAKDGNKTMTLILRVVGFILMFLGFLSILKPLSVIADVVPFIGSIVAAGSGLIAFVVSAVLSLTTIAIAWVVYRPLLGVGLLIIAGGLVYVLKTKLKKSPKEPAPAV